MKILAYIFVLAATLLVGFALGRTTTVVTTAAPSRYSGEPPARDRSADALTLKYVHAADAWPYPYRARQGFRLTDAALSITLEVENLGGETMPAGLGLHPYFDRRDGARVAAAVDRIWLTDDEVMPTGLAPKVLVSTISAPASK